MKRIPIPEEVKLKCLEMLNSGHKPIYIYENYYRGKSNMSYDTFSRALRKWKHRINGTVSATPKQATVKEDIPHMRSVEYKADGSATFEGIIELMDGEPITPEIIMKAHNLDSEKFEVISYKSNFWQAQQKGGSTLLLYQSKISVRPKKDEITLSELQIHFETFSKEYQPQYIAPVPKQESQKMLEINICDLHLAKLGWHRECGENYDSKIARKRFMEIIDGECARLEKIPVEKILFVWCNDFFNSDNMSNTTTGGTSQHTDVRWQKMFLTGVEMLVEAIDKLQHYAPVETFYIASNHCRTTEFYAINYLYAWFRNNDRVKIDLNCKARYYYQYGVNLIGFSHSYYEKKENLPGLMSIEVPEMWAKTTYREYHLAHIHCEEVKEKNGIIFRWLPSVTGSDAWHYDSGYIGATKRSYSFLWDKEHKLESINVIHTELS